MPRGKPIRDPQRLAEEYPQQFADYSPEALQAAMDAYNGALAQGLDNEEAMELAHIEASRIDGSEAAGRSSETLPRRGAPPRVAGGERPVPEGGVR